MRAPRGRDGLTFDGPVLLAGGGEISEAALALARALSVAVIAADGGADRLAGRGLPPDVVIGDMDSIEDPDGWRARLGARFVHVAEQDSTDLQKCLSRIQAPLILALGFTGARMDHTLAAMTALVEAPAGRVLMLSADDVILHAPRRLSMRLSVGDRVSLFPMTGVGGVASTGLRWPIKGLHFAPAGQIGVSNEAVAEDVTFALSGPGMVLILPLSRLEAVTQALTPQ